MAFGTSIFLFAAGAVLTYGVTATVEGVNLDAVGVILMIVGAIGFVLSGLFWASWAPFGRDRSVERETIIRENGDARERERTRTRA